MNNNIRVRKIRSGGQTGSDLGGLKAAKILGLEMGGTMPKSFINHTGCHPEYAELYNIKEDRSTKYPPRTRRNVIDSDGTVRIAKKFHSAGEKCTLKYITRQEKPYFDVDINNITEEVIEEFRQWLIDNEIEILNVAGNSEKTCPGIEQIAIDFLVEVLK